VRQLIVIRGRLVVGKHVCRRDVLVLVILKQAPMNPICAGTQGDVCDRAAPRPPSSGVVVAVLTSNGLNAS